MKKTRLSITVRIKSGSEQEKMLDDFKKISGVSWPRGVMGLIEMWLKSKKKMLPLKYMPKLEQKEFIFWLSTKGRSVDNGLYNIDDYNRWRRKNE